jgi:site-specific DNA recombinase
MSDGVLGAVRLSRMVDESTSPARQLEQIETYSKLHGKRVVHVTTDTDVSGAVPAAVRPELGPWLTQPHLMSQYDTIVVAKLDRISRSVSDLCALIEWCKEHDKSLVSIAESFDMSTAAGRMVALILGSVAAFERERTAERRREAADWLRQHGRWGGGVIPYGYQAVPLQGGGWELVADTDEAEIVRWAVAEVLSGRSVTSICDELTTRAVPTSRGRTRWHNTSLTAILRSPMLVGQIPYNDGVVRDDDGMPITREPILDSDTWNRLQSALDRNAQARTSARSSPMIGVLFCALCESSLYFQRNPNRPTNFYRCGGKKKLGCTARVVPATVVEEILSSALLLECGDVMMADEIPPTSNETEIASIKEALASMEDDMVLGTVSAEAWARATARLETRLAQLEADQSPEPKLVLTGKTFAQTWDDKSDDARRVLLVENGIRAWVERLPEGRIRAFGADASAPQPQGDLQDGHILWLPSRRLGLNVTVNLGRLHDLRERLARQH